MTDTTENQNPIRFFQWQVSPIAACRLSRDDIKRLYKIIDEKLIQERDHMINSVLVQQENETFEHFQKRRTGVRDAFMTTITVTGTYGENITGHGETFLDSAIIPEKISKIYFDTKTRAAALLSFTPLNWANILLDFTVPSPLTVTALPSAPTENASGYTVTAQNEAWGTSLHARLDKFFTERKTSWDWLHRQGMYDLLLMVVGFPLALWGAARMGHILLEGKELPTVISTAAYVYLFFALLNVFRGTFTYARWVFPKIELISQNSSIGAQRVALLAILLGVIASAIWDAVKAIAL